MMSVKQVFLRFAYLCVLCFGIEASPTATPSYDTIIFRNTNNYHKCHGIGYDFAAETERCYKFHPELLPWIEAREVCRNEGGDLAIMNSDAEVRVVVSLFMKYPAETIVASDPDQKKYALLGYYFSTNYWKTVEGQPLEQPGHPNKKYTDQPLLYPFGIINRDGMLWSCNHEPFMFICEKGRQVLPVDLKY